MSETIYIRFLSDFTVGTWGGSMSWKAGDIEEAYYVRSAASRVVEVDWGCGQIARFWEEVNPIRILSPIERLALEAEDHG